MGNLLHRFINDQAGVTAIEYALIALFVALAIIAGATALGTNLNNTFTAIAAAM